MSDQFDRIWDKMDKIHTDVIKVKTDMEHVQTDLSEMKENDKEQNRKITTLETEIEIVKEKNVSGSGNIIISKKVLAGAAAALGIGSGGLVKLLDTLAKVFGNGGQ